jgi:cysteine desulfurase / selenocysteine lyase
MTVYFNNAATGFPKPESVLKAVNDSLKSVPCHHLRSGFDNQDGVVNGCRERLAELFNSPEPRRFAFSSGATESLNLALKGLGLKGKHVVTTAVEHNSVLRPLKTMEREGLLTLSIVPCDPSGHVSAQALSKALRPETALIAVNHCSNVTGTLNDAEAIGAVARKHKAVFLLDASQSAGVYPIDITAMNIDILVFTGHKALNGLQGIGGIYIGEDIEISPLKVGGTGIRSDYLYQPEEIPLRFEAGTMNLPGIISMNEGVKFILDTGMDNIRRHKEACIHRLRQIFNGFDNVHLFPENPHANETAILSFVIENITPADTSYMLENSFEIITRSGLHCAPLIHEYIGAAPAGTVRVSPSWFTTEEELTEFERAIEQIVRMESDAYN